MKKTYSQPEVAFVEIDPSDLIATSPGEGGSKDEGKDPWGETEDM